MLSFYLEKLNYLHALNCAWIKHLTSNDEQDLPIEVRKSISALLNFRHIWYAEQNDLIPDSELDDLLPEYAWLELELDNGRVINDYMDRGLRGDAMNETALFLLLKGSIEYLGQLNYVVREKGLDLLPNSVFPVLG